MVVKRKTISKVAQTLKARTTAKDLGSKQARKTKKEVEEPELDESESDEESGAEETSKIMKKPSAATAKGKESDSDEESAEDSDEDEEEDVGTQVVAFQAEKEPSEKDIVIERTKELKSISASDLKELLLSNGLETGTKEVMIRNLLKHEAKARVAAREQKAKIRDVVIKKKQELEDLSLAELGKLCNATGLPAPKGKPERVQRLLVQWQESDGVDQALAKIAQEERKNELGALDCTKLRKFCNKLGLDPFVKEVMVERISKHEHMNGCYARPAIKQLDEAPKEEKKRDMIDDLLANEAQRKKEKEARSKQEQVAADKKRELKSMSAEELKKRLAKRGLEATGKREDMVEALFIACVQDDLVAARKVELQAKSSQELKDLLSHNGLETGPKDQMVKTMLAHEAKCREELKAFEGKVDEVIAKKEAELETKSNAHLKELCATKGLPVGGDMAERIERLLEEAKKDGEFDKVVSLSIRNKRKDELMALDKIAVLKLCEKDEIDPFVKEVMVERIMSHEIEAGAATAAVDAEQPASKRARTANR